MPTSDHAVAAAPAAMPAAPELPAAPAAPEYAPTPTPAPALEYAAPAASLPEFTTPSPSPAAPTSPAAPGYAFPPAAPAAAAGGFVLPGTPVAPITAEDLQPRTGKHADAVPEPAAPAPALPAVRPVGFTSSADPEIANRYRSVIHTADQDETPAAAPSPAPVSMLASTSMTAGRPFTAPSYASVPDTNRAADLAFRTGLGATFGVVVGFLLRVTGIVEVAGGFLTLGAWVSGIVAIIAGIVGLVAARRRQVGFGKSLTGLLLGVFVSVLIPVGFVLLAVVFAASLGLLG